MWGPAEGWPWRVSSVCRVTTESWGATLGNRFQVQVHVTARSVRCTCRAEKPPHHIRSTYILLLQITQQRLLQLCAASKNHSRFEISMRRCRLGLADLTTGSGHPWLACLLVCYSASSCGWFTRGVHDNEALTGTCSRRVTNPSIHLDRVNGELWYGWSSGMVKRRRDAWMPNK